MEPQTVNAVRSEAAPPRAASAAFAKRLNAICKAKGMAGRGLQTNLGKKFGVSPNGARKWLLGEGMPELAVAIEIAMWAGVTVDWLLTGRGAKTPPMLTRRGKS